jgi:hypothetical protein
MVKLKYVELDEETGEITINFRGRSKTGRLWSYSDIKEALSDRQFNTLIKTLDADIGRFNDVVEIVEELANFIFRGRCEGYVGFEYVDYIAHYMGIGGVEGRLWSIFKYDYYIMHYAVPSMRTPSRAVIYESSISMENILSSILVNKTTRELVDRFFEELAETFENRDLLRLKKGGTRVAIYENERRFKAK